VLPEARAAGVLRQEERRRDTDEDEQARVDRELRLFAPGQRPRRLADGGIEGQEEHAALADDLALHLRVAEVLTQFVVVRTRSRDLCDLELVPIGRDGQVV